MVYIYSVLKKISVTVLFIIVILTGTVSAQRGSTASRAAQINNENYILHQNYPNPFNPSTTISYTLKQKGFVSLKVFSILGKEVTTLVNEEKQAGNYQIRFTADDNIPSGIYLYQLNVSGSIQTKRFILLK